METKTGTVGISLKGGAAEGSGRAVFSTLNVIDHDGDVTLPGAFSHGATALMSAWNHKSWETAMPIGRGVISVVGTKAVFDFKLFLNTESGRDAHEVLKELGELARFSYGFDVEDHSYGEFEGQRVRFLKRLKVHEVSPVLRAAGIGTELVGIKQRCDIPLTSAVKAELAAIRDRIYHHDAPSLVEIKRNLDAAMRVDQQTAELRAIANQNATAYSTATEESVQRVVRDAAQLAIAHHAKTLTGLPPGVFRIKYFSEEPEDDGTGAFGEGHIEFYSRPGFETKGLTRPELDPTTIWLHVDLGPQEAYAITSHELAHLGGSNEAEARRVEDTARYAYRGRH